MRVLGIETSCDETGVAVYDTSRGLLAHALYSQIRLHAEYGGVVPELASRDHVQKLLPMVQKVVAEAGGPESLDGVVYTAGPGLVGALLVGACLGRSLAFAWGVPALGVHHMEGHLLAPMLEDPRPEFPFVALLVSGGHSLLVDVEGVGRYRTLGESIDDAAGEAFDKVAKLLGLGFPGGPIAQRTAETGDAAAIAFPASRMTDGGRDFSFSGIKTSVSLYVKRHGPLSERQTADVAASFQAAVVRMLVRKTIRVCEQTGVKRIVLTGGVAANRPLGEALAAESSAEGIRLHVPPPRLCTDNAAMIAAAGTERLKAGERATLDLNAIPDLVLAQ